MSIKHAKFSASASARWLNCPASVKVVEKYKNTSSKFAQEGTCAHELAELCLTRKENAQQYLGQKLHDAPDVVVDQEMINYVQEYIDYVLSFDGDLLVEQRVDYSNFIPEGFGTSDAIVFNESVMHVFDLKYGKGLEVLADNNTQGMLYALGALNDFEFLYDIDLIVIHIYQPRIGNISDWSITKKDLLEFAEYAKERAHLAMSSNAPFNPGEKQCQWCLHKANCTALLEHTQQVIGAEFDNLEDLPESHDINPESVRLILSNKKLIESWLSAVEELAFESLLNGEKVEGFKLVEGRSVRRWIDGADAQQKLEGLLGEDAYTKKLMSPTQACKALGANKDDIADLIEKPPGKPTLAPNSDKRKPFGDVTCEFESI